MKTPLPVIDGVGSSRLQLPRGPWKTVLEFLVQRFPDVAREAWRSRLERGLVVDEGGASLTAESPYLAGLVVFYYRELEKETSIPFVEEIIHRDEHIVVVDKPHFLPVQPSGRFLRETLLARLNRRFGAGDIVPLHRLDRATAGIVLFSVNPGTRGLYAALFPEMKMTKIYEALAGALPGTSFPLVRRSRIVKGEPFFRMKEVEGPANAQTRMEIIDTRAGGVLYRLIPSTGRKHQLRVHLAALGIPIMNDDFYPDLKPEGEDDFSRPLKLLARSIAFRDPLTGKDRYFASNRNLSP